MKKILIVVIILVLIGLGFYFINKNKAEVPPVPTPTPVVTEPVVQEPVKDKTKTVIGTSVEGREIIAYHFGEGDTEIIFVGGIHGGYSWNTTLVARRLMDYLMEERATSVIPANVKVTVIPVLNL